MILENELSHKSFHNSLCLIVFVYKTAQAGISGGQIVASGNEVNIVFALKRHILLVEPDGRE